MTYMVQGQTQYSTERKKSRKNKTPVKRNGKKEKLSCIKYKKHTISNFLSELPFYAYDFSYFVSLCH